jgi:hypothetical protein
LIDHFTLQEGLGGTEGEEQQGCHGQDGLFGHTVFVVRRKIRSRVHKNRKGENGDSAFPAQALS